MGTNFYFGKKEKHHIGKRSAAGLYCWDCSLTLREGGEDLVHHPDNFAVQDGRGWHKKCPKCGKKPIDEGWESSVGRELGFAKLKPGRKKGVASCSSFTWAMKTDRYEKMKRFKIYDEYGREFSREDFNNVLLECPIRYYHMIGQEFF